MKKYIFILSLIVLLINCQNKNSIESFDSEKDTPAWLKVKIDSMSTNNFYVGSKVYRHTWHNNYIYYIHIGLSSCMYCEVYYENGSKVKFTNDYMLQDYLNNRKNEVLIWEWKD